MKLHILVLGTYILYIYIVDDILLFILFQSAIALTKDMNYFIRKPMSSLLNQVSDDTPFVTVSVNEFCFGYQNSIIKTLTAIAKLANKPVPFEKFGLLSKVNQMKQISYCPVPYCCNFISNLNFLKFCAESRY